MRVEAGDNISEFVFPNSDGLNRFRKVLDDLRRSSYVNVAVQTLPGYRVPVERGHILRLSDTATTVLYHAPDLETRERLDNAAREILAPSSETTRPEAA